MSEKEKETIEDCKELVQELKQHKYKFSDFIGRLYYKSKPVEDILSVLLNLIEKQQQELNNIKEIEKTHKEKNGKLRVEFEKVYEDNLTLAQELEQEKEKNKLSDREKEIIKSYRMLVEETGREDWIICNPKTMWCNYFVSKETIMQEIKNIEKRMETATNSTEYKKLHCAQEYLRGLLWEV